MRLIYHCYHRKSSTLMSSSLSSAKYFLSIFTEQRFVWPERLALRQHKSMAVLLDRLNQSYYFLGNFDFIIDSSRYPMIIGAKEKIFETNNESTFKEQNISFKFYYGPSISSMMMRRRLTLYISNMNRKSPSMITSILYSWLSQRPTSSIIEAAATSKNVDFKDHDNCDKYYRDFHSICHQQSSIRVFSSSSNSVLNNDGNETNNDNNTNTDNILIDDNNDDDDDDDRIIKFCWKCNKPLNKQQQSLTNDELHNEKIIIKCSECQSLQKISMNVNYFQLFNMKMMKNKHGELYWNYDIDLEYLRQNYLCLQQQMHPDRNINRSNIENELSLTNSAIINNGYRTLRDPYQRALYMLRLMFNIVIDEDNVETEPELLLEIMELNEEIEMANNDNNELRLIMEQLEENIENLIKNLSTAFEELNSNDARRLTIKYSYYNSVLAKLKSSS